VNSGPIGKTKKQTKLNKEKDENEKEKEDEYSKESILIQGQLVDSISTWCIQSLWLFFS